ncbi:MAG: suppressor of fused domain protein [Archangium sp.]
MGFLGKLFKSDPPRDAVKTSVQHNSDGSQTVRTEFSLKGGDTRPVRDDVVTLFDDALQSLGGNVMHAMDPSRLLSFEHGGPPIWSVGMVELPSYTLLMTYGFSHALSPEKFREGLMHEFSFAVPKGTPLSPWADAFLRHQARYVLTQGSDIRPNDCVPFRGVAMTRIPFQPAHHAMMPDSSLVGMLATIDPVLPRIDTPHGAVEVRRLVCIDSRELDRAETWSAKGFLEELRKADPLLLSPLTRRCLLDDAGFGATVEKRFASEGSDIDAALFDLVWDETQDGVELHLPESKQGAERFANALRGRVGFGRKLVAFSMHAPPIVFTPGVAQVVLTERSLEIGGDLSAGAPAQILSALLAGEASVRLPL